MSFLSDFLGPVGSLFGIGSGIKDLLGGSQQGGSSSRSTYVPTGLGSADQLFQQLLQQGAGGAAGQAGQINPVLAQAFQAMLGIPTSGLTGAANQAGQISQGLVPWADAGGQFLGKQANLIGDAGQQLWQTALDPQNALRNRLQQQVTDASRASTSSRGIGMGGEAAGIENQAVSNFLQDWNNQQLQRQYMGLQGMGGAFNQAGRDVSGALAAGALGPQFAQQAGQIPYGAQMTAAMQPFNAANAYTGSAGGANQNIGAFLSQIIPYLNQGLGATGQSFAQGQAGLGNLNEGLYNFGQTAPKAWQALSQSFSQPNYNQGDTSGGSWTSGFDLPFGG